MRAVGTVLVRIDAEVQAFRPVAEHIADSCGRMAGSGIPSFAFGECGEISVAVFAYGGGFKAPSFHDKFFIRRTAEEVVGKPYDVDVGVHVCRAEVVGISVRVEE